MQGRTLKSLLAGQDGFTLPELLIGCSIGIVVLGATLGFIAFSSQQSNLTVNRVDALDRATQGIDRMSREMRSAIDVQPYKATATASSYVDIKAYVQDTPTSTVSATAHSIRYDCNLPGKVSGTYRCDRIDNTANTRTTIIDGITGSPSSVFTINPPVSPAVLESIGLNFSVRIDGANNPLVLTSRVTPRNCQDGPPAGQTTCAV